MERGLSDLLSPDRQTGEQLPQERRTFKAKSTLLTHCLERNLTNDDQTTEHPADCYQIYTHSIAVLNDADEKFSSF